jgi:hypothetical protein
MMSAACLSYRAVRDKLADGLSSSRRGSFYCDVISHERFGLSRMRAPVTGRPFERGLHAGSIACAARFQVSIARRR